MLLLPGGVATLRVLPRAAMNPQLCTDVSGNAAQSCKYVL